MTFSLLARDPETGALGAAATTGNLCVGGWVLRGDARTGLSASQGLTPSTLWGEDVLARLAEGQDPSRAVEDTVRADPGRAARQMSVLTRDGRSAVFSGADNLPFTGHLAGEGWILAGNWLQSDAVLARAAEAYARPHPDFATRLLAALRAGVSAGSDRRGTLSAALRVLATDRPPLDLRVDWDPAPLDRIEALLRMTRAPDYSAWLATLPTRAEPEKA